MSERFYVLLHACGCAHQNRKKPSSASEARLHDSAGRGSGPRRCLDTDVHSPTTIEPARSLRGAGGEVRGALGLGSNYCDRVLLTARTASSHFQRALVKSFYGDETAGDTCQSQRLPTEHNTWKTQRQRGRGRRRRRRKTHTRVVVNRKSGKTAAPYFFLFLKALQVKAAAPSCQNVVMSLVKKDICIRIVHENLLLNTELERGSTLKKLFNAFDSFHIEHMKNL